VFLVGCVSAPAAQAIRMTAGVATVVIVSLAIAVITWAAS
jgi:hypothetical protein